MDITVATQTLAEIKGKIAELQKQADAARAEEVAGVVGRIREAITYYDLSIKDIFGGRAPGAGHGKARKSPGNGSTKTSAKKAGVIRFRDSASNEWTGRGKRPNWFKAAIADGATPEDLAV
jgi:DNA-binding protein H-NS